MSTLNEFLRRFIKRVFDIIFSLIIIIFFLSWFMPIVSLLIRMIDSAGPALFIQERFGMKKKPFKCLKFRTLTYQKKSSVEFEPIVKKDPRVSRIGKILRKTNLDELPQFINVLKGDMSIVGPRPEREFFIEQMKTSINKYLERHRVKCGVTGWAQVNGLRGSKTPMQTRIDYDIYYIEYWSLLFDLKILWLTLWKGLVNRHAY